MSCSSGSSSSRSSASSKISVKKSSITSASVRSFSGIFLDSFLQFSAFQTLTDDQLALIEETLDLIMWEKYGCVLDGDDFSEILPEKESPVSSAKTSVPGSPGKLQDLILSVTDVQEKISRCLFDVQSHLGKRVSFEEDEEDEARRRRKRFEEFSTRLSRNYLYRVSCLIAEIPSTSHRRLLGKTNQLFTEILHALRFYCNNMVNYSNEMQHKKLRDTVEVIQNGIRMCLRENIFDAGDELVRRISEMCSEIDKCCEVPKKPPKRAPKPKSARKKPSRRRSTSVNPLAMYLPYQETPKKLFTRSTPSLRLSLQDLQV